MEHKFNSDKYLFLIIFSSQTIKLPFKFLIIFTTQNMQFFLFQNIITSFSEYTYECTYFLFIWTKFP